MATIHKGSQQRGQTVRMRTPLTSPTASAVGPYSHGIDAGGIVFCSGQTPVDPATGA